MENIVHQDGAPFMYFTLAIFNKLYNINSSSEGRLAGSADSKYHRGSINLYCELSRCIIPVDYQKTVAGILLCNMELAFCSF